MDGIITILILFFVFGSISRLFRKTVQPAKKPVTQPETEATKPRPTVKPVAQRNDYRFPAKPKAVPAPVVLEGSDPNAKLTTYTPIVPSQDLQNQFSNFQGSLVTTFTEGAGYQPGAYEPVAVPYRTDWNTAANVLPESFNRDALLQAVVMSEILKRPGARR